MPRGDGTGPGGQGSRTGRGLGYCSGYSTPGYAKGPGMGLARGFGRGRGTGFGRGLAWRRGGGGVGFGGNWGIRAPLYEPGVFAPPIYEPAATSEDQIQMLKQEKEYLELEVKNITNALEQISKKISEFEKTE